VVAIICQIVFLNLASSSDDMSLALAPVAISTQLAQCLSICMTCALYLKPFLDSLESGFIHVGDLRRQHSEGFGYMPKAANLLNPLWSISGRLNKSQPKNQEFQLQGKEPNTTTESRITEEHTQPEAAQSISFDERETSSRSQILHTREWVVQYEG
jgi:hypothetical protein